MKDDVSMNIPSMSVGEMSEHLSNMYISLLSKKVPVSQIPSVMLWGSPGIGKSQGVVQTGREIERAMHKKAVITEVRLILFNPIDLRGIPTFDSERKLSVWLKPKIFQMDSGEGVVNILFLDDITSAPQSVQAAAYQITLNRMVGEHRLPDNCIVIAAGNRVTDKSIAYKMPKALANRMLHINIESSFDSWKKWAIENRINDKVIGFLSFKRHRLNCFETMNDDLAFPTPRTWEFVSNLISGVDDTRDNMIELISGLIGYGVGMEFKRWLSVYASLPDIEEIFEGKDVSVPKGTDSLYALSSAMVAYAREHKDDLKKITNSIAYARKLPPEYSVLTLKDYLYIDNKLKKELMKNSEFVSWLKERGALVNAVV